MKRNLVKRIITSGVAILLTLSLAACSSQNTSKPTESLTVPETQDNTKVESQQTEVNESKENEKMVSVILVNATMTDDFSIQVAEAVRDWCAQNNFSYELQDPNSNADTAIKMIESSIVKKPDILIVNPLDADALVDSIDRAVDAGIIVASVGNVSNSKKINIAVHSDHYQGGVITSERLVEAIGYQGKLITLGLDTRSIPVEERVQGFMDVISNHPEIEVLASQYAPFDSTAQMAVAENMLQAHPEAVGCFADLGVAGIGMAAASIAAGRSGFMIVDIDADKEVCRYIKSGDILCAAAQLPYEQAIKACEEALKSLRGEPFEAKVLYEHLLTDASNVDEIFEKLYGYSLDEYIATGQ